MRPIPTHLECIGRWRNFRELRTGVAIFLTSTGVGLFFTVQIYLSAASSGHAVGWSQAMYWALGDWYEWALLSPAIVWTCGRFRFDRPSWLKSLPAHIVVGVFLSAVHAVLCALAALFQGWITNTKVVFGVELSRLLTNRFNYNLAVYFVIVGAWHAWDYYRKFKERDAQAIELAARLAEAQLQSLRMQLNPHFLFNTLNSVSSLMLSDVFAANKMISRLSDLLRLTLENTEQHEVPLRQEISFLQRYLEIQKIRFGDRLNLKVELDPATLEADVPSLILQPIVENAVRHAIELRESAGRIEVRSIRENGCLVLSVSDNGPSPEMAGRRRLDGPDDAANGIGLVNTRERLRTMYGDRQRFRLIANECGGMTATLSIPFHEAPSHAATA